MILDLREELPDAGLGKMTEDVCPPIDEMSSNTGKRLETDPARPCKPRVFIKGHS